ncbi:MAG: hypothetical protein WD971_14255 [Pirellulales bacterium]
MTDPSEPVRDLPDSSWPHYSLYKNVREAIASLPVYFRTETQIAGIMATDLHTLNSVLGATIEEQVVRTLNLIRNTWDPDEKYGLYTFVRQPQTFPDVILRKTSSGDVLLGIELKGWYLLAKESEPSLRFRVSAAACTEQDLIVVVPWVLGSVISGSPILFAPFIESAKYAAEFRNYHWQHVRRAQGDASIEIATEITPYPTKSDHILDKPKHDTGNNFGRIARTGLMDTYMQQLEEVTLCGINVVYWREFLKAFQESATEEQARGALDRLKTKIRANVQFPSSKADAALAIVAELEKLLDGS